MESRSSVWSIFFGCFQLRPWTANEANRLFLEICEIAGGAEQIYTVLESIAEKRGMSVNHPINYALVRFVSFEEVFQMSEERAAHSVRKAGRALRLGIGFLLYRSTLTRGRMYTSISSSSWVLASRQ